MAAMNLLEEYLVLHETESMGFDREASKIACVIDKKLSTKLGWSETIFNFSSKKETRNALYAIIFHELSDEDIKQLSKEVEVMRAEMLLAKKCLWF
jgi:predicted CopG family antitoxin